MTVVRMDLSEKCLPCPDCGAGAIPASEYGTGWPGDMAATWTEDDEADCPGCGVHLVARITGDGESEWIEAAVEEAPPSNGDGT